MPIKFHEFNLSPIYFRNERNSYQKAQGLTIFVRGFDKNGGEDQVLFQKRISSSSSVPFLKFFVSCLYNVEHKWIAGKECFGRAVWYLWRDVKGIHPERL